MGIAEHIGILCVKSNISKAELARRLNVSPQSFNGKMKRESFTISDLEKIADVVDADFRYGFEFREVK